MATPMDDWRSPNKRKAVIQKLEESIKALGNPPANLQNPVEVEKAFFEKSKNWEEYRNNYHNIILMLTRQKQAHQTAQPNPSPGPMMNSGRPMVNVPPGQQMINQPNPGYQQPYNQYGGMAGAPNPNPAYPPGAGNMSMGAPQRPQQPPQYHPGMYPQGGNPNIHMNQQGRYPSNMQMQGGYPRPTNYSGPHNMGVMSGGGYNAPGMQYNQPPMMSGQGVGMHGPMRPQQMMRPQHPRIQNQMQAAAAQNSPFMVETVGVQPVAVPNPSYTTPLRPTVSSAAAFTTGAATSNAQLNQQGPIPFGMTSPSAKPAASVPAGAVASTGLDAQNQLPSGPGSVKPPTPHAGNLQGPVPSPAPPTPLYPASPATSIDSPATQPTMTPEENEAYLRKLGELQKYIPLMSKWINRLSKDDRKSDQFLKLKSLHNLLQDNNRRVPLQTLMKCEVALEKMFRDQDSAGKNPNSVPPPSVTSLPAHNEPVVPEPKFSAPPQSQSLLDFKMTHSPPATHSNLMEIIQPREFPLDLLPPSKRACIMEDPPYPPSLRLEMAHLGQYSIKIEPKEGKFDKSTTLRIKLVDEDLPEMPPLTVILPPTYPALSPICDLKHYQESSSPFIREVASLLSARLSKKTFVYSLVTFLDNYEMSLLRAISKELEDN